MRILVTTGASGGHIYPARSFCDEVQRSHPGAEIMMVEPARSFVRENQDTRIRLRRIPIEPLGFAFNRRRARAAYGFLKSSLQSLFLVAGFRPQVVVGFGSVASLPVVLSAWFFRIPTLLHEQNVVPGKANIFLSAFVDKIAVSFPESRSFFKSGRRKIVYTGNPLRRQLKPVERRLARSFFHLDPRTFTVLVAGGSQGSRHINTVAQEAVVRLRRENPIQVIHLTGERDFEEIRKRYRAAIPDAAVLSFLEDMQYAYSAADLIISRAGATTVAEIIAFGIPAILVPYPFAYAHQEANAMILAKAGCAAIIKDAALSREGLQEKIDTFLHHGALLARMHEAYRSLQSVHSAGLLVKTALALVQ